MNISTRKSVKLYSTSNSSIFQLEKVWSFIALTSSPLLKTGPTSSTKWNSLETFPVIGDTGALYLWGAAGYGHTTAAGFKEGLWHVQLWGMQDIIVRL